MEYVRIFAEGTVDNPDVPPIWVDAIIDEDGKIIGRHTLFGIQGSFTQKEVDYYPFTLSEDGQIDFGRGFDQPAGERYATLDLRDDAVRLQRLLILALPNYGQWFYRIAEIIPLGISERSTWPRL